MNALTKVAGIFHLGSANASGGPGAAAVIMAVVLALLLLAVLFSLIAAILLALSFSKYSHQKNRLDMTGEAIARQVLDEHELQRIQVAASSSLLLGNSYSRLFKKVRLRRSLAKKASVAALAMAVQKSCLAILDQQGDAGSRARARRAPLVCLAPPAVLPLIVLGWLIDLFAAGGSGWLTVAVTALALVLYVLAFLAAVRGLKTEKKAQETALSLMETDGLADEAERESCKKLYRLYNIEYLNNMVLGLLELLYRALQLFAFFQSDED